MGALLVSLLSCLGSYECDHQSGDLFGRHNFAFDQGSIPTMEVLRELSNYSHASWYALLPTGARVFTRASLVHTCGSDTEGCSTSSTSITSPYGVNQTYTSILVSWLHVLIPPPP